MKKTEEREKFNLRIVEYITKNKEFIKRLAKK